MRYFDNKQLHGTDPQYILLITYGEFDATQGLHQLTQLPYAEITYCNTYYNNIKC